MRTQKLITLSCVLLFVLFSFGCETSKQSTKENKSSGNFTISGQINNPQNGKVILSKIEDVNRKKTKVIGEFPVDKDGKFNKDFDLEPHIYELDFYGKGKVTLAVNKGQHIKIVANGKNLKDIIIDGSEDTQKFLEYEKIRNESLDRLVKSVRKQIKDLEAQNNPANREKIEELGRAEIANYEKHRTELNNFIKEKMGTSIAIYPTTLRWDGEENINLYESIAKSFSEAHPDLAVAKRINEKVEVIKSTIVGGKAASIKMPDKDGKEIKLSDVKGKYILIDFWASWCGPCRRESQKLTGLYKKYKAKGFEVYGVSLDTEKDLWLKAIEKDGRVWTNVSTLQGFETPVTFEYGVTALPSKILIDAEGKIVAKNLHGDELTKKVDSLFSE